MIRIFRKSIRHWYIVLWVILLSLGLSSLTFLFQRGSQFSRAHVALVNGDSITYKEFRRVLADTQQRIDQVKRYAQMLGMSEDFFLQSYYKTSNPHEIALKTAIRERLIDQAKGKLNISIANEDVVEALVNSMPEGLLDERGRISMDAYNLYLKRMGTTSEEFELRQEREMARQLLEQFVINSCYIPRYTAVEALRQGESRKRFAIGLFSYDHYFAEAKNESIQDDDLKKYYDRHKDRFFVSEKRKALFWRIKPSLYAKNVEVEDEALQTYYQRHKSSEFRIPPKVKVRRILLQGDDAQEKAISLLSELKQNPNQFAQKAEALSAHKELAKKGGLTDFFTRGTFEKPVEDAAFRLMNKGDISDVVATEQGYEIIQLEERISANEQSFEEVREKIKKSLIAKKSLETLKSDLEFMLHDAKENSNAIKDFVEKLNLKQEQTSWLDKQSINKHDMLGQLAEKLFSGSKRVAERGYFFDGESYIIYLLDDIQKAYSKPLESVEADVREYYFAERAHNKLQKAVSLCKEHVASGKRTLNSYAGDGKEGFRIIETALITPESTVPGFKEFKSISPKAFELHDEALLLQQSVDNDVCLVQLVEIENSSHQPEQEKIQNEIKKEFSQQSHHHMNSFIASLERNAKIERFDASSSDYQ